MNRLLFLSLSVSLLQGCGLFALVTGGFRRTCGDHVIDEDRGELCDDGNTQDGDGCRGDCKGIEVCGDGLLDFNEECDDGNTSGGDGCSADCSKIEVCGDALLDAGEACDDGNTQDGDGCRGDCLKIEVCGDALLDAGEACDDGNTQDGDGCRGDCLKIEVCGDALLDAGEACDDGNTTNGDGCDAACVLEFCGDTLVNNTTEECDDGNTTNGDGCDAACVLEFCGDTLVNNTGQEQCDDGNTLDADGCEADCTLPFCGNDITDPGELCDDRNTLDADGCEADCTLPFCGNDITDPGELCDDGNTQDGDGCRADCTGLEVCGDGLVDVGEVCDDGNNAAGDGCRADCRGLELCGDALTDQAAGEVCDDGNNAAGDGCRADCLGLELCSDGFFDPATGETCDDGNLIDTDDCDSNCQIFEPEFALIPFEIPRCDGVTHSFFGAVPVAGKITAIPMPTRYGFRDNDPGFDIDWVISGNSVTISASCTSGAGFQGFPDFKGFLLVLSLPLSADIVETPFVFAPPPGTACDSDTISIAPLPLSDNSYAAVLRITAIAHLDTGGSEDDLSYQLQISQDNRSLQGRLNANSNASIRGVVYQIGLPAGFFIRQGSPGDPFCFTKGDGSLSVAFNKSPGVRAVPIFSITHYVTENTQQRGDVDTCDLTTVIPANICATNTNDRHGFDIEGDFDIVDSADLAVFSIDPDNASNNSNAIGGTAVLLEFP